MTDGNEVTIAELRSQVERLTKLVESMAGSPTSKSAEDPRNVDVGTEVVGAAGSRRHLIKLMGGAAAAAVVGGAVATGAALPAAANSEDQMIVGRIQTTQNAAGLTNGLNPSSAVGGLLTTATTLFAFDNSSSTVDGAVAVRADSTPSGTGLDAHGGTGVHGLGTRYGLVGGSTTSGGVGVGASGPRSALRLIGLGSSAPPLRFDAHEVGEIDVDVDGSVWCCVGAGAPGVWRKLAGPTTAGSFHAISPTRAFDSRWPGNSRMGAGSSTVVSVADAHDLSGTTTQSDVVAAGATAVAYNITVTGTVGSGYLSVNPGGTPSVTSSSVNWFGDGQDIANGSIVAVDSGRRLSIFAGGGGSTDFVVDITGFFR